MNFYAKIIENFQYWYEELCDFDKELVSNIISEDFIHDLYNSDNEKKVFKSIWDLLTDYSDCTLGLESAGLERKSFIKNAIDEIVERELTCWDFYEDMVEDMVSHMIDHDDPITFFRDLNQHGCVSGMVGMFVYNADCKKFYIDHIDDMEGFMEEYEDEIGIPLRNIQRYPHYVFVCWFCYEELGHKIAESLFEEEF